MMPRTQIVAATVVALMLANAAVVAQPVGSGENNAAPPPNVANRNNAPPPNLDLYCRRQAADQTGYRPDAGSGSEQAYGSAYYACMDSASNAPPPPPRYSGGPYPYPYPYPNPYPYPYYYGPYWGGPAIGLSFGFGRGFGGGFGRGGRR